MGLKSVNKMINQDNNMQHLITYELDLLDMRTLKTRVINRSLCFVI